MRGDGRKTAIDSASGLRAQPLRNEVREGRLKTLRESDPKLWAPLYGQHDRALALARLDALTGVLREEGDSPALEAAAITVERVQRIFDWFESRSSPSFEGSFAFVVAERLTRQPSAFDQEADGMFPLLRYLDPSTSQLILTSFCPFPSDTYRPGSDERCGVMIVTPLTPDITGDLGVGQAMRQGRSIVSDALRFARDTFGVSVAGLGGTLPRLTNFGRAIDLGGINVTTGHGGTVWLICRLLDAVGLAGSEVGIIGAGAIGSAVAGSLLASSQASRVRLFDINPAISRRTAADLAEQYSISSATTAESLREVLQVPYVVAAATSPIDLNTPELADLDLTGTVIVDDSQPSCFDATQVESRGGRLAWVVGADRSPLGTATKTGLWGEPFDYGGTGPAQPDHIWGCEAEVHAIWQTGRLDACLTQPVRPEHVQQLGELCQQASTVLAPLQRAGQLNSRSDFSVQSSFSRALPQQSE